MKDEATSVRDLQFEALLRDAVRDVAAFSSNSTLLNGRFVIRRRLGSGGMGVVYEALDNSNDTSVALKVLSEVNPSGIYRLKQEFRALAHVLHPNLVVMHELFVDNGIWFFTMDLVVGQTLLNHLNIRFDLERLKQVFGELAAGIHAIHTAGKLHRDLKPNNVLVTPQGHVRILDFGLISDQEAGGVGQTVLNEGVSGTPTYMAPEQTESMPSLRATDWYAFGVMLFEALTGRLPFEDTPKQVITRKRQEEAPRPSLICPGIPDYLDQLSADLLRRRPEDRPDYNAIVAVLGEVPSTSAASSREEDAPFIGREPELASLEEAFRATDNGRPVMVFVEGPSGIGKSTLIDRFLDRVRSRSDVVILKGRCYERESLPFKACDSLIDDLTHYLRQIPNQHAARLMPRKVTALAKIFPVLNRLEVVRETRERFRPPANPSELRRVAFFAAKELMARLASQEPLILYVDDLQWSDVDGVKMLMSLVSPPEPPSMLLIGAYRSGEAANSAGLTRLRERIRGMAETDIRYIHLEQLNDDDARRLATRLLTSSASKDLAGQIAAEAKGSPFFIAELVRFVENRSERGEEIRLEKAIEHRISGLSERARDLMALIAVSGRPVESSFLQVVMDQGNISGPLRTLDSYKLIQRIGGSLKCVACFHDRIRETVVSALEPETLRECHQRLAFALEIDKNPDPVMLTEHLRGAGDPAKAGEYAVKAARLAEESLAFENAARFYREALTLKQFPREEERCLESALGEALAHAGRGAEAAAAFMQAAVDAPPEEALTLRCQAAQQWINTGHLSEGTAELDGVLRAVGLKLHAGRMRSVWSIFCNRGMLKIIYRRINRTTPRAITGRQLLEIRVTEAAMLGLYATDTIQATAFCSRHLRWALQAGIPSAIVKGLCSEATFRVSEGSRHYPAVERFMRQAEALSEQVNDSETHAYLKLARGMVKFAEGRLPQAIDFLEETERFCLEECTRKMATLEMCQLFLGASYSRLGRWAALQPSWDRWVASTEETGNLRQSAACRMWLMGTIRWLAVDQVETAQHQLEKGVSSWAWPHFDLQRVESYISQSYIYRYTYQISKASKLFTWLMSQISSSYLRHLTLIRVHSLIDYTLCTLALAAEEKTPRHSVKIAERMVRRLRRERIFFAAPYIAFFTGTVAHIKGDDEKAVQLLRTSIEQFEQKTYYLQAAAIKRRLGGLIGGDEGRSMVEEGGQTMTREGVLNLSATTLLLAPGFAE